MVRRIKGDATKGRVIGIHLSEKKGTEKQPVDAARVTELGLEGDAHAGRWHRQVSLLDVDAAKRFTEAAGITVAPGEFAENLLLEGVDLARMAPLDRLTIGNVELEITQIGKECHGAGCSVFRRVGKCLMPEQGLFARVVTPGPISVGMPVTCIERPLTIRVITLSDRASVGEYEDRSGAEIAARLDDFFAATRWHQRINRTLIPDDAAALRDILTAERDGGTDLVFTTGGTGIGPRDITPETVLSLADKEIPGIMDHIRLTYGATMPGALLSRSVAVVMGNTLVFALPGNVKAVKEYMAEILKNTEHLLLMLRGIGH